MRNGALWGKKEEACKDEEIDGHGDQWDHVVIDAESKAVISIRIHGVWEADEGKHRGVDWRLCQSSQRW